MKPEFSKPFSAEHTRAGAPFCGANGEAVRVLIWDRMHPTHPIIVIEEHGEQEAVAFRADGTATHRNSLRLVDKLVMLPLGQIDGKPVFVGDELIDPTGATFTPGPSNAGHLAGCRWPAPAKAYPEATMRHDDMFDIYAAHLRSRGYTSIGADSHGLAAVANAALRHAVDAGQIVNAEESAEAVRKAYADGQVIAYKHEAGGRAARDMVIAKAIRDVCMAKVDQFHNRAAQELLSIDLARLIQTVQ